MVIIYDSSPPSEQQVALMLPCECSSLQSSGQTLQENDSDSYPLLDTARCVSTIPPAVTTCDQISPGFPLCVCTLQAIQDLGTCMLIALVCNSVVSESSQCLVTKWEENFNPLTQCSHRTELACLHRANLDWNPDLYQMGLSLPQKG